MPEGGCFVAPANPALFAADSVTFARSLYHDPPTRLGLAIRSEARGFRRLADRAIKSRDVAAVEFALVPEQPGALAFVMQSAKGLARFQGKRRAHTVPGKAKAIECSQNRRRPAFRRDDNASYCLDDLVLLQPKNDWRVFRMCLVKRHGLRQCPVSIRAALEGACIPIVERKRRMLVRHDGGRKQAREDHGRAANGGPCIRERATARCRQREPARAASAPMECPLSHGQYGQELSSLAKDWTSSFA
jgi:hypothetical protein